MSCFLHLSPSPNPGYVTSQLCDLSSLEPQLSYLSNGNELAASASARTEGVNTGQVLGLAPGPGNLILFSYFHDDSAPATKLATDSRCHDEVGSRSIFIKQMLDIRTHDQSRRLRVLSCH